MPISRALLNRLRLPYKALDIQGSRGDVLYVPDDVGIDLSVIHGVHNGDMVPVKSDAGGVVSVVIDNSSGSGKAKHQYQAIKSIPCTDTEQSIMLDTSTFLNYLFLIVIESSTDETSTILFIIDAVIGDTTIYGIQSTSGPPIIGTVFTGYSVASNGQPFLDVTRLKYSNGNTGAIAVFSMYIVGWN